MYSSTKPSVKVRQEYHHYNNNTLKTKIRHMVTQSLTSRHDIKFDLIVNKKKEYGYSAYYVNDDSSLAFRQVCI